MAENTAIKKVDYTIMSGEYCIDCGNELKENKVKKGHERCFVCFKLYVGKPYAYAYEFFGDTKVAIIDKVTGKPKIRRDFAQEQKQNRIKNGWNVRKAS